MIEIDEQEFISSIWNDLASGYNEPGDGIDSWPEARGFTEQLYAQMLGWA